MTQENQGQQGQYTQLPDKETISKMSDSEFSSFQEEINSQLSSSSEQSSTTQQQNK